METPGFKIEQSRTSVAIIVRAPDCDFENLKVSLEDNTVFIFSSNKYYLRLHLTGQILEDHNTTKNVDLNGRCTFHYRKVFFRFFPNLHLIRELYKPSDEVHDEVLAQINAEILSNLESKEMDEWNEEFGFALAGKKNFHPISSEFQDVFEVDPREVHLTERHKMRVQQEQKDFDVSYYLFDYIDHEDDILRMIKVKSPWEDLKNDDIQFTDKELAFLKDLPNTQYNLTQPQINYCYYSLIDILFAYCYDKRINNFELVESSPDLPRKESGPNIIKLAASFCWLDAFKDPEEALTVAFRRSLIYTYYRNFQLSQTIFSDLKKLLNLNEKYIIKCLIEMHDLFLKGKGCSFINDLFIKDYIIYITNYWDETKWREIVSKVQNIKIDKDELGLPLAKILKGVCGILNDPNNPFNKDFYDSDDESYDYESGSSGGSLIDYADAYSSDSDRFNYDSDRFNYDSD